MAESDIHRPEKITLERAIHVTVTCPACTQKNVLRMKDNSRRQCTSCARTIVLKYQERNGKQVTYRVAIEDRGNNMARRTKASIAADLSATDFFAIIKTQMEKNGIKRTDLSKKLRCSSPNITQLFQHNDPKLSTMCALCDAVGLTLSVQVIVDKSEVHLCIERRENQHGKSNVFVSFIPPAQ